MKLIHAAFAATLGASLAQGAGAAISYDAASGILTDTTAQQAWVLRGIGFEFSYLFPGFANTWVAELNDEAYGGLTHWRLPSVVAPSDGTAPAGDSGDLGRLYANLSVELPDCRTGASGPSIWAVTTTAATSSTAMPRFRARSTSGA
ncbi:MAG: DUF1566 domain-containing protein [Burkholderiaceae bacterium]|nr:DUF1566 domain-containing protein [Burkholderiaceae bacterium]